MVQKVQATAFRTVGGSRVPLNTPSVPGIDEQLIEKEEREGKERSKLSSSYEKHTPRLPERQRMYA